MFVLSCKGNSKHEDVSANELDTVKQTEFTDLIREKKNNTRRNQYRFRYSFQCKSECGTDSTDQPILEDSKLKIYKSEFKRDSSKGIFRIVFNDDCCAEHVSFVSKAKDSLLINIEQNSLKVCECICPYEYELIFKELDTNISVATFNGRSLQIR